MCVKVLIYVSSQNSLVLIKDERLGRFKSMSMATPIQQRQPKTKQQYHSQEKGEMIRMKTEVPQSEQDQPGATGGLPLQQTTQAMKDIDIEQEVFDDIHLTERIQQVSCI